MRFSGLLIGGLIGSLGVGALLRIIGYVAPVPAGDIEKQQGEALSAPSSGLDPQPFFLSHT